MEKIISIYLLLSSVCHCVNKNKNQFSNFLIILIFYLGIINYIA